MDIALNAEKNCEILIKKFTWHLFEFILDIFPVFSFRDISYKQPRFGLANIYFQCFPFTDIVRIELWIYNEQVNKRNKRTIQLSLSKEQEFK